MYTVINHLHFDGPAAAMAETLQQGVDVLSELDGFEAAYISQEGDDRVAVVIVWGSQAQAETGAASFGPTFFAQHLAPRLASPQQRTAGEVLASAVRA